MAWPRHYDEGHAKAFDNGPADAVKEALGGADMVNHPPHYARLKPEPIDVIESWGLDFHLGQVVKYTARAGHKDDAVQDLKKAQWYLTRKIESLTAETKPKPEIGGHNID